MVSKCVFIVSHFGRQRRLLVGKFYRTCPGRAAASLSCNGFVFHTSVATRYIVFFLLDVNPVYFVGNSMRFPLINKFAQLRRGNRAHYSCALGNSVQGWVIINANNLRTVNGIYITVLCVCGLSLKFRMSIVTFFYFFYKTEMETYFQNISDNLL